MKLRNKKTGEIVENAYIRESHDFYNKRTIAVFVRDGNRPPERVSTGYDSLAELNAEWEDYHEEPKGMQWVDVLGANDGRVVIQYSNEEEAELAVRKLKAWKRLKDYNVKFNLDFVFNRIDFTYSINNILLDVLDGEEQIYNNMKIIFGGEE